MRGFITGGSVVLVMIAILLFATAEIRAPNHVSRLSDYFWSLRTSVMYTAPLCLGCHCKRLYTGHWLADLPLASQVIEL
jgi:hypothetical protein